MLLINFLASCWCAEEACRVGVGVDVATSGSASDVLATCVRIGGIVFLIYER